MKLRVWIGLVLSVVLGPLSENSFALSFESSTAVLADADRLPPCVNFAGQSLALNNAQVMQWRSSTPDQFLERAFVSGTVTDVYPDRPKHEHFAIDLDRIPGGDIEIIYNREFGALPEIRPGMRVVACGDYITVGPRASRPSPMGAILHWVHYNPGTRDGGRHPHGFVAIGDRLYGFSP